ncbi:MBL fold metallo-hydrolase [Bacillus xiapuensis]|uniref:MBL fold metallo-hydrolase n=1 Tax=Bacillus xiapuensis TaxID=2014075 RepID=UPI000C24AFD1|nr:MBL fold metallo-hydrolase [Bacillus xiapuensis]
MTNHSDNDRYIPMTSINSGSVRKVLPDLFSYTNQIVNLAFIGSERNGWVMVDAGMPKSAKKIIAEVKNLFGEQSSPQAILLTHGHFDHVGSAIIMAERWGVPVYAHPLEYPYLTGKKQYPAPDPAVEGGLVAKMAGFFPKEPIDLGKYLHELPADGTVPGLPEWQWIHTPGHTDGHVSFFRPRDRALIAGDAFITVKQDALFDVAFQIKEVNGPPRYFTPDWQTAWNSVKKLAELRPAYVVPGHGQPMEGEELAEGLSRLVEKFPDVAIPDHGKYVDGEK